jgi:HPt (histidine-containing phosphotransfer) domain-containing protein
MVAAPVPPEEDAPEQELRAARDRLVAGFASRCAAFEAMVADVEAGRAVAVTYDRFIQDLHRLAGLAGMVGLPTVSVRARDLETLARDAAADSLDAAAARRALDAVRLAFDTDLAAGLPEWMRPA